MVARLFWQSTIKLYTSSFKEYKEITVHFIKLGITSNAFKIASSVAGLYIINIIIKKKKKRNKK